MGETFESKEGDKGKPYNAIVGGFWNDWDGKRYIMAYGNDLDGDIAAIKKLISARDLFLNKDLLLQDRTKVVDDYDLTGIAVADLLRNPSNWPYYSRNRTSERFAEIVERILNNNNDVWEIEMNGGENTECSTCPDYTYQDQVDYFWPILIAGVMN